MMCHKFCIQYMQGSPFLFKMLNMFFHVPLVSYKSLGKLITSKLNKKMKLGGGVSIVAAMYVTIFT